MRVRPAVVILIVVLFGLLWFSMASRAIARPSGGVAVAVPLGPGAGFTLNVWYWDNVIDLELWHQPRPGFSRHLGRVELSKNLVLGTLLLLSTAVSVGAGLLVNWWVRR